MEEARYSVNLRFNYRGYDSQFTMRSDDNCHDLITKIALVVGQIEKMGGGPGRRWEDVKNGNNKTQAGPTNAKTDQPAAAAPKPELTREPLFDDAPDPDAPPTCRQCGTNWAMELIEFERNGHPRKAWKCQTCDKWHYEKKGGS